MNSTVALLVVFIAVASAALTEAKDSPAPVDCTTVVLSMSDCLSYVTNGSTVQKPEGNCCSGLKSVLKTNAECLCEAFKSSSQFGIVLDVSKALALPDACHVHASKCGLSLSPTGAPSPAGVVVAPAGAPTGAPIANAPSMGAGSNVVSPALSPTGNTGSASAIGFSAKLVIAGLAAAFFSSF
ncbi:hypothetical protein BVRB_8g190310 [Beta vulgaris subsp. vulgaris]|nr:hypothetical protein BVRB_8g190310 [Beta vulgaris subsp. vulgaris]